MARNNTGKGCTQAKKPGRPLWQINQYSGDWAAELRRRYIAAGLIVPTK